MVARSAPTLRFSSVRHKDPSPTSDPQSKISSFTTTTTTTTTTPNNSSTVTTRRHSIIQQQLQQQQERRQRTTLIQSKLPFAPPSSTGALQSQSHSQLQQKPTKTTPASDRPFKKAKLDGRHYDQAPITRPAKLPLRSRDSQGLLAPSEPSLASRTRSSTGRATTTPATTTALTATTTTDRLPTIATNTKSAASTTPVPPRLTASPASPSAETRTTRQSVHSHRHLRNRPVAVNGDVENKAAVPTLRDTIDNNNSINTGANANAEAEADDLGARNMSSGIVDGDGLLKNNGVSPSTAVVSREKRSLRSNDGGSRSKSELAMYFQNYEQIVSLEPIKPAFDLSRICHELILAEFLCADTHIFLIDDLTQAIVLDPEPTKSSAPKSRGKQVHKYLKNGYTLQSAMNNPLLELHDAQILNFPSPSNNSKKPPKDPLDDDVYFKAHRRLERQEKQLRNIERERAQHEKVQLDRLLDELQGHDWLRVMGISGITETEKKLYEPKRAYFIKEVTALIEKFRVWKEEEKRRKIERDQILAEEDEDGYNEEHETGDEGEEEVEEEEEEEDTNPPFNDGELGRSSPHFQTYGEPPDINDVDAWAAHQLHQEAISASTTTARYRNLRHLHPPPPPPPLPLPHPSTASKALSPSSPTPTTSSTSTSPTFSTSHYAHTGHDSDQVPQTPSPATTFTSTGPSLLPPSQPQPQPEAEEPFTSFYTKRYLRDAAVGKSRHGGRRWRTRTATATAFGQPLPEIGEQEFELPGDILTEEAIEACQRKKRRLRRERG
ncbi:uncharacterized protein PADG_02537 [Paracoccidioides brasiliensis Pb18]|uniref:Something about silencing protein 4 domain-containing protein n=1 Tax=Paracoccidioides brasiliensis (strain Pb18) TaxID=502780 RepID=C1G5T2_PARBD|nr:uncharacterized protein PADG_02537 [Paracoccidioides brasiliensis Pb18]EEH46439.2 hypothetical protein PADG_02537 [Paracoccidioides brasiliensis Pb18]